MTNEPFQHCPWCGHAVAVDIHTDDDINPQIIECLKCHKASVLVDEFVDNEGELVCLEKFDPPEPDSLDVRTLIAGLYTVRGKARSKHQGADEREKAAYYDCFDWIDELIRKCGIGEDDE